MKRTALFVAVSMTGCYFHAVDRTTSVTKRAREMVVVDGPARLSLEVAERTVRVRVMTGRMCTAQTIELTESTTKKVSERKQGEVSAGTVVAAIPLLALWPVTLATLGVVGLVSGVVTGVRVSSDDPQTTTSRHVISEPTVPCGRALAEVAVELVLPSGAVLEARTDRGGLATFVVPEAEPSGQVIARVDGVDEAVELPSRENRTASARHADFTP